MSDLIVYGKAYARDTLRPNVYANGRTQIYVYTDPAGYAAMVCDVMSTVHATPELAIESVSEMRPLSTAVVAELARVVTHHGGTV